MKYFLSLSFLLLLNNLLFAQDWTILGTGVNGIAYDLDGTMWLAGNGGVYHQTSGGWVNYNAGNSPLRINKVYCVEVDASGNKWFGLLGNGLMKFDGANWTQYDFIDTPSVHNDVYKIKAVGNTIWATGYYLIGRFDGTAWSFKLLSSLYTTRSIVTDPAGNAWIRTTTGLCKYDGSVITYYTDTIQTSDALGMDSQNNFWLYSDSGLVKFDGVNFHHLGGPYTHTNVTSIFVDANDDVWLGAKFGNIHKYSSGTWTDFDTTNSPINELGTVQTWLNDTNGNMLIGSSYGGLISFDGSSWSDLSQPPWTTNKGLGIVSSSAENSLGETWVSGWNYMAKINGSSITNYDLKKLGFPTVGYIRKIFFDQNNLMWLATDKGIITYDGTTWTRLTGTNNYSVQDIIKDPVSNDMFFSADVGLLHYDGVTLTNYTTLYSPAAQWLNGMCFDIYNQLWVGSRSSGLIKVADTTFTYYNNTTSGLWNWINDVAIDQNNIKCLLASTTYYEFNDITNQIVDSIDPYAFKDIAIDAMNNRWLVGELGVHKKPAGQHALIDYTFYNSAYPDVEGYSVRIDQNNIKVISTGFSGLVYLDDATVGVSEYKFNKQVAVFPNPASDRLNISLEKSDAYAYCIYDYSGRLLEERNFKSKGTTQIDVSAFPAGVYMLQLLGGGENGYSRFVIMK